MPQTVLSPLPQIFSATKLESTFCFLLHIRVLSSILYPSFSEISKKLLKQETAVPEHKENRDETTVTVSDLTLG